MQSAHQAEEDAVSNVEHGKGGVSGQNMPPLQIQFGQGGHFLPTEPQTNWAVMQAMPQIFPSGSNNEQALHEITVAFKSAKSPEELQHIVETLKSNPQLMALYIKQRQLGQTQCQLPVRHVPRARAARQAMSHMFSSGTNTRQAFQQIVTKLKSPHTPEVRQQILQTLNSNSELIPPFVQLKLQTRGLLQEYQTLRQTMRQALSSGTITKQELQEVTMKMKSPQTPEVRQHIMQIVDSNPHLKAFVLKRRQLKQVQDQLGIGHATQANEVVKQTDNDQTLQQLTSALKLTQTPEDSQQVLQMLKWNSQLQTETAQEQLLPQAGEAVRQFSSGTNDARALQQLMEDLQLQRTSEEQ